MSLFKGQDELNLTEGGIVKPLLYLSLPIVVTNLLQTAYNLADTFWLGQYSTEALAAISFAFPMVFLLISLGMGLSVAGSVLVAQHTGAEETDKAEYAASQTVTFAFLGSAMLGAFGYPLVRPFLDFLGASPDVLPGATAYMQVIALGLPFMFGFFVFISLMRGAGDTITPMLVMFGTVVLNVVLDPFFINGWALGPVQFPRLGIQGAAIATVISRVLAMVVGIAIMVSGSRGIQIHLTDMRPDFRYLRKILRIGIPASVEGTGRALSINALLIVVGLFSTSVVAAFGIGTRVFSVIFLPAIAVARGVETMSGQNIGAGKYDRAEQANYVAAKGLFFVLGLLGVAIFFVPEPIVSVFTTNAEVLDVGAEFLRYVSLSFGFIGIMRAFTGGFRGAGKTLIAAVISVVTLAGIRLPVAFVASQGLLPTDVWFLGSTDVRGIWIAFFVSNVVGAAIAWLWFRRGTWREGDVRGTPAGGELENDDVELSSGMD
ncbi:MULTISPECIES: MATE family efflux transporter [Haloferax]|uniref:MATE family efflux transporter n=5 Tax=Haloferax TaxID=2251 RepID=A0A558G8R2_HALVO|nr:MULTISPECIES: MATE family efflux transporter [Haloferax]ELZ72654.1 multi antimicrobial extrusion family drug/sodium antiporter [Haloferax lucentense DSM 14919]ELZ89851.1 multi antimicrobial extrusion family drug/sodium antiporter [Haloferax alexandrinus JCM 10717]MBC9987831.1 MATE family efflux transporter [Haloferax sp. AS1]QIB77563.1 MATE family efflux transporter [Haloferax alexandrinus]RDZ30693.1 MATE family efflux transporter [Haloferax sp. Atlit-48N]